MVVLAKRLPGAFSTRISGTGKFQKKGGGTTKSFVRGRRRDTQFTPLSPISCCSIAR